MEGSDPLEVLEEDSIDIEELDYTVESLQDVKDVVGALIEEYEEDFYDILDKAARGGWADEARLASALIPYVNGDYEWIDRFFADYDTIDAGGAYDEQMESIRGSPDSDINDVARNAAYTEMTDDGRQPAARAEKPPAVYPSEQTEYAVSDLTSVYHDSATDTSIDVGHEIETVLIDWHPEDFGFDSEDRNRINQTRAVQRIAEVLDERYDYLYPEESVRGWQHVLHVYDDHLGIYRPRGEAQIKSELESHMGAYASKKIVGEIVSKMKRRNHVDNWIMRDEDPDPYRLVCGNGIIDLRTGELDDYTPEEYHRRRIDVDYDPDAECPEIDSFLAEIVDGDDKETLYRIVAHTLPDEYIDEKAAMLVGDGNNGKSAFLNLIEEFLADRNVAHRSLQDLADDRWAPADLHQSFASLSGDMSEQEAEDLSTFKQLTGGDTVTADIKYKNPVRFTNSASLIFASNGVPDLPDTDMAVWQRWTYVNFPHRFGEDGDKEAEPMPALLDRITSEDELEGLLARCVDEICEYFSGRDFFPTVGDAREVRKRMKKAAEPVYRFADECLVEVDEDEASDPGDWKVWKARVRQCYREYAREEDLPIVSKAQFGKELMDLREYDISAGESKPVGPSSRRDPVYKGIQLTDDAERLLDDEDDESENSELDDDFEAEEDGEAEESVQSASSNSLRGQEDAVRSLARTTDMTYIEIRDALELPRSAGSDVQRVVMDVRGELLVAKDDDDRQEDSDVGDDDESVGAIMARSRGDD